MKNAVLSKFTDESLKKNKNILGIILDIVLLCGHHELPLRGHNESEN